MRIAYVEDNAINLALVQRIAMMSGHVITSYTEGETALAALSQEIYDLIMMDVELAGELNGLQVVRALWLCLSSRGESRSQRYGSGRARAPSRQSLR